MIQEKLKEGLQYFEARNYDMAKELFHSLNDNVIAQYYLGAIYRMGLGTQDDQKEAFKWFLKAAKKGHVESQYLVGCAYTGRPGLMYVETDLVKNNMENIERKSAEDKTIWQDDLPYFDLQGIGVEPDNESALKWLTKAANQNYVQAIEELGIMYDFGIDVEKNETEALQWYRKATDKGSSISLRRLAIHILPHQKNFDKAIELLIEAYKLGDNRSAYLIAETYDETKGKEKNYQEALKWYKIAAEEFNHFEAQMKLGDYYLEGKTVEVDIKASIKWYKKAIESFNSTHTDSYLGRAYKKLYDLYNLGYQEAISVAEIIEYLKHEVDYNSESARDKLKEYYLSGYDVGVKYKSIFELLEKAEQGDEKAQIEYGYSYIVNSYVENATRTKVIEWYLEGAANGNQDSQYILSKLYAGDKWGIENNYWLKRAANQGHAMAQYDLAQQYMDDNHIEAIKYLKLAAESYVYAQIDLGYDYAHGNLVKKDYKEAYKLYQKAALNMMSIKDVSELRKINYIKFRYNAANDETEVQANLGNIDAQLYMGCLYQYGFEVKRNKEKAIYWYSIAKKQGSDEANMQLEILQKDFD